MSNQSLTSRERWNAKSGEHFIETHRNGSVAYGTLRGLPAAFVTGSIKVVTVFIAVRQESGQTIEVFDNSIAITSIDAIDAIFGNESTIDTYWYSNMNYGDLIALSDLSFDGFRSGYVMDRKGNNGYESNSADEIDYYSNPSGIDRAIQLLLTEVSDDAPIRYNWIKSHLPEA